MQKMTIYHKLYSLNQFRNEHYHVLNKIKIHWSNMIHFACIDHQIKAVDKCKIRFTFIFKDKKRRDIDNYCATVKMVMDGLIAAKRLKDDSIEFVKSIEMTSRVDKKEGIEIEIEEIL